MIDSPSPSPADSSRSLALSTHGSFELDALRDPRASYQRSSMPETSDGIPWARYADAIKRHLLIIILLTAMGSAGGYVMSKQVEPIYDVQARLWINVQTPGQGNAPIQAQQLLPSNSWTELVRTFAILDPAVSRLRLHVYYRKPSDGVLFESFNQTPDFRTGAYVLSVDSVGGGYSLTTRAGVLVERGVVGDSIGRKLGFLWKPAASLLPPSKVLPFSVSTPRAAALGVSSRMRASVPENGQFLSMSLSDVNPRRAAATLNAVAEQLVSSATDLKKHHVIEFRQLLAEQLSKAETQLHTAEMQLEDFRVNTITLPSDNSPITGGVQVTRDPVLTNYFQEKTKFEEVKRDRADLERILAEAKGGAITPQSLILLPTILNNNTQLSRSIEELTSKQADLRAQQQKYTELNPIIKNTTEAIRVLQVETIPQILRSVLAGLRQQEAELTDRIASQSTQLKAIPPRTIEEMRLMRQVSASEALANSLKSKYQTVLLSESETTPDLRILDTAVAPNRPTSNDGPRLQLLAIIASFGAAIAFALLHDKLDRRFRYPDQATTELGLDIAGTVPRFKANRKGELGLTTMSQVVESFRTLRLSVRYQFPVGNPVVVAVSSPGAGEGKSLVSANLAMAFANAGHKTLLIDGDVRRGALHKVFDLKRCPGLVEYLCGDASAETVVRATPSDNLFLIPCGSRRVRAPELLVSERMASLLMTTRQQFDVVIVDAPPLAAGMDAYALAAAAGSMLIVLRPAVTDRKLAAIKLEILDRLPVRILGSVINGISGGGAYRYYGNDYNYGDETPSNGDGAGEGSAPIGVLVRS